MSETSRANAGAKFVWMRKQDSIDNGPKKKTFEKKKKNNGGRRRKECAVAE